MNHDVDMENADASSECQPKNDKKVIIGRTNCPWTQKALTLNWHEQFVAIDQCRRGQCLRDRLQKQTGHKTVPFVFNGLEFIGGCSELERYIKSQ